MAIRSITPLHRLVQGVRRAALVNEHSCVPDGRLVDAFLDGRDEAAFETLVKKHGPMVLGVCRRVIGNVHDAEDAFQAVFLVLARKAGSIVPRGQVGNWLHGVAYRTALQARSRLGRHRARERQVTEMPQATVLPDVDLSELHQALDRELHGLPEKYRVPIVLCELEGRSRKDVARQLKIPEGTLSSRLAKARDLLAQRLARHGVALSASALTAVLVEQASAALTPGLVAATVQAATLAALGQSAAGLVSAQVVALSQGVMKTMFLDKIKVVSLMLLGVLLGGFGIGLVGLPSPAAIQAAPPSDPGQFVQAKAADKEEPEPLDGKLLLNADIQKELRLSKNQISKLQVVSQDVDKKNISKKQTIHAIDKESSARQKEIEQLQRQIAELQQKIANIRDGIETERTQSLGKAAPDILSAQAVQRLRQIQRQQRGLDELLQDAKIQRMLKVDDEQLKKIETIVKSEVRNWYYGAINWKSAQTGSSTTTNRILTIDAHTGLAKPRPVFLDPVNSPWVFYSAGTVDGSDSMRQQTMQKLFDVLNDAQQHTLLEWIGQPYQSATWQMLHKKQK
jgi:RNA polymerase sigma factor (sigma-70 family)